MHQPPHPNVFYAMLEPPKSKLISILSFIHKTHHEWTAPIGIVSIYAHPLEHAVANLMPPALGPLLLGSHLATAWLWFALAIMSTTVAHSGYHLPFFPSPEAHDYHHLK